MDSGGERLRVEEITTVTYGGRETMMPWIVSWSAVWVGALSAVVLALIFGLIGLALGAHRVGQPLASWREVSLPALALSVLGSFLAFALGGWVAAKVADLRRSETAMLHGAIAWLVAVPLLVTLASMGAAGYLGGWYGGLAGVYATAPDPAMAAAARNGALAAVAALLLGLMGGVIGGWMGSGEPMTFNHYRTRQDRAAAGGW